MKHTRKRSEKNQLKKPTALMLKTTYPTTVNTIRRNNICLSLTHVDYRMLLSLHQFSYKTELAIPANKIWHSTHTRNGPQDGSYYILVINIFFLMFMFSLKTFKRSNWIYDQDAYRQYG